MSDHKFFFLIGFIAGCILIGGWFWLWRSIERAAGGDEDRRFP